MPEPSFAISLERVDPVIVVAIRGDLDASTTGEMTSALEAVIQDHDRHVVVDGNAIDFIDSTGITALIGAMRRLNRTRRRLALVHGPGPLSRALQVTGLEHTFEIHPTVDAAVTALGDAPRIGR
jgi:anti-sigma B factor antagonist